MTRKLLVLFLAAMILCLSCVRTRTVLDQGGYQHLTDSVVVVFSPTAGMCAGVNISQDRILTNAHCLHSMPIQVYEVMTYRQYLAEENGSLFFLSHADTVRDLAILQQAFEDETRAINIPELYEGQYPNPGSDTIVIGHPAGQLFNMTNGMISRIGLRDLRTGVDYLFSNAPVWYGNSGGPIFNQFGEMIGITRGIRSEQPFLGQFVSYTEIREFLNEISEIEEENRHEQEENY